MSKIELIKNQFILEIDMKDIGIVITFEEKVSPAKLEKAINLVLNEYGPENPEVIPGSFYTSAGFVSFEAYEISFDFLGQLYHALCKAIIKCIPSSIFNGYAHYADEQADFEGWYVYEYENKTMQGHSFTTRFGFDGSCPVCGDMILTAEDYLDDEEYFCDTCEKVIDLKDEFNIKFSELPSENF